MMADWVRGRGGRGASAGRSLRIAAAAGWGSLRIALVERSLRIASAGRSLRFAAAVGRSLRFAAAVGRSLRIAGAVGSVVVVLGGCEPVPRVPPAPGEVEGAGVSGAPVDYLSTPAQDSLGLPFSEAVRVGKMLYLSGQVGNRPGELAVVPGGIQAEAEQTMENIKTVLERWGSSMDRVVKCTVMIDDIDQWGAFNEVYVRYFPGDKPARSALGADGLALGAAVEVECWATVE